MKSKAKVSHFLIVFCNMVSTLFGKKVKRIRTDNGEQFQSNRVMDFYKDNGVGFWQRNYKGKTNKAMNNSVAAL